MLCPQPHTKTNSTLFRLTDILRLSLFNHAPHQIRLQQTYRFLTRSVFLLPFPNCKMRFLNVFQLFTNHTYRFIGNMPLLFIVMFRLPHRKSP